MVEFFLFHGVGNQCSPRATSEFNAWHPAKLTNHKYQLSTIYKRRFQFSQFSITRGFCENGAIIDKNI